MSSPGHRAHVLDPAYTEFGSTMAFRTVNGIQHKYWTVVFGRRDARALPGCPRADRRARLHHREAGAAPGPSR